MPVPRIDGFPSAVKDRAERLRQSAYFWEMGKTTVREAVKRGDAIPGTPEIIEDEIPKRLITLPFVKVEFFVPEMSLEVLEREVAGHPERWQAEKLTLLLSTDSPGVNLAHAEVEATGKGFPPVGPIKYYQPSDLLDRAVSADYDPQDMQELLAADVEVNNAAIGYFDASGYDLSGMRK